MISSLAKKKGTASIIAITLYVKTLADTAIAAGVLEAAAGVKDPLSAAGIGTGAMEATDHNTMALTGAAIAVRVFTAAAGNIEPVLDTALDTWAPAAVAGAAGALAVVASVPCRC